MDDTCFLLSVGIGWGIIKRLELQNTTQDYDEIWKFNLQIYVKKDHSDLFIRNLNRASDRLKGFVFLVFNWEAFAYQRFQLPMTFSSASYNWCVTGSNKLVRYF